MEVPREQRRCSFEAHLVYCWPFWFNLYHQRALLIYWQPCFFSLGHRHWVNKFQVFLFFSFILLFFFCVSFACSDGPTLIRSRWTAVDIWSSCSSGRPSRALVGEQLTEWHSPASHLKTRWLLLTQTTEWLLHKNSGSTHTAAPALFVPSLAAIRALITINFDYLCICCHSERGSPTWPNIISLFLNL